MSTKSNFTNKGSPLVFTILTLCFPQHKTWFNFLLLLLKGVKILPLCAKEDEHTLPFRTCQTLHVLTTCQQSERIDGRQMLNIVKYFDCSFEKVCLPHHFTQHISKQSKRQQLKQKRLAGLICFQFKILNGGHFEVDSIFNKWQVPKQYFSMSCRPSLRSNLESSSLDLVT